MPQTSILHTTNIYEIVKAYAKIYPKFKRLYIYDSEIKQRIRGFEEINPRTARASLSVQPMQTIDSLRRTKTTISDIIQCNQFDSLGTFTFAKDRQNITKCKTKMSKWLKNQQKIHGKFEYIIIPEFHKDQKSIHFHALLKNYTGNLTKTKIKQKNRIIYNIKSYKSGYSTLVKIDNIDKVSTYVKKYITKEMPQFNGKKRYWSSQNLTRPIKITNPEITKTEHKTKREIHTFKNLTIYEVKHPLAKEKGQQNHVKNERENQTRKNYNNKNLVKNQLTSNNTVTNLTMENPHNGITKHRRHFRLSEDRQTKLTKNGQRLQQTSFSAS
jgi:hypothetical protein